MMRILSGMKKKKEYRMAVHMFFTILDDDGELLLI